MRRLRPKSSRSRVRFESLEARCVLDSTVVFNELMYHPLDGGSEWIELHNQMAIDMDLSGWSLGGGVDYKFAPGTVVPGGGYLVVVAGNPATSGIPNAVGPFTGQLSNSGESIELYNNSARLMDAIDYADASPWPVGADGSGAPLMKINPDAASKTPENWRASNAIGGTPGLANAAVTPNASFALNELTATGIELLNTGGAPAATNLTLVLDGSGAAQSRTLTIGAAVPAQGFRSFSFSTLNLTPMPGDRLFLFDQAKTQLLDAVTVEADSQGRYPDGGDWRFTTANTLGAANVVHLNDSIVINEIMYHRREDSPHANEAWIELYNRGAATVDLGGWQLDDAVSFTFPIDLELAPGGYVVVAADPGALGALYPGLPVLGPWSGNLSRGNERIRLLDTRGNPADEVHYYDGGRWPEAADGGGSSLELRDPWADNSVAESWAASDESSKPGADWQTYTYSGPGAGGGASPPASYNEFVLGLLDAGEVLVDDIRVIQSPSTPGPQLIQNSTFDTNASTWRIIGNHSGSVVPDPDDPTNGVLRLVATGSTEHMHNHAETTLKDGANYAVVSPRHSYEISFRAKWISGSNQLNTRLWFNRVATTTLLATPEKSGTPGAANSRMIANAGPTFEGFQHGPVVPAANAPVTVSVTIDDPQGIATASLHWSAAGGAWNSVAMAPDATGKYVAQIPGQPAATVVQFYVEATDDDGATATYPAAGAASRALYTVNDGAANLALTHNVRIVMTAADTNALFLNTNLMSNGDIGATVIYNESEVFYNVGVRLKGSEHGRADNNRIGFILHFDPDHLFRGVHDSVAIDRSGGWRNGTSFGQDEIVIRQIVNHAGNLPSMYDDLVRVIAPRSQYTGGAILQMARYGDVFLDSQYEDGGEGTAFEYELLYAQSQTVGGVEGLKIPQESGVTGTPLRDLGDDPESYRNYFLIKNNRDRDDYAALIPALKTFSLTGAAFLEQAAERLDVDQWLRSFAVSTLVGAADNYVTGSQHNLILYVRPSDGKLLYLPWDMDFAFVAGFNSALVANGDLSKLLAAPANLRAFRGHLLDILDTTYNSAYMSYWTNHLDNFLPGQNFSGILSYIAQREAFARSQLPAQVPFAITTNGGAAFTVDTPTTIITGDAWINVREIRLAGLPQPLELTWTDADTWQAEVPLAFGVNQLEFQAYGYQGQLLTTDTIQVTSNAVDRPLHEFLRITELMYHPADPSAAEQAAGFTDAEEFEFIEIVNTSTTQTLTLTDASLAGGIDFTFPEFQLGPGEYAIVAENMAALAARYDTAGMRIAGQYTGKLSNSTDVIQLLDPAGSPILDFTYFDVWSPITDGEGKSLVIVDVTAAPDSWEDDTSWRASHFGGGSPGRADVLPTPGDTDGNGVVNVADLNNVRNNFGAVGPNVLGDTNGDDRVDVADLNAVRNNFGNSGGVPFQTSLRVAKVSAPQFVRSEQDARDLLFALWAEREANDGVFAKRRNATRFGR
jgi:hypothetical protein